MWYLYRHRGGGAISPLPSHLVTSSGGVVGMYRHRGGAISPLPSHLVMSSGGVVGMWYLYRHRGL